MLYITHKSFLGHKTGFRHPESAERPRRLDAVAERLAEEGIVRVAEAPRGDRAFLETVHAPAYVSRVLDWEGRGFERFDSDTVMSSGTPDAASRAVGAVSAGVDAVLDGRTENAFCAVRPPGHHALYAEAKGFCFFNNVVLAARHALERRGLAKVAVLDFDAHHANGTEALVSGDDRVLLCQTFQDGAFPFTGKASDTPALVNVPLAAGAESADFRRAVEDKWLPAVSAFSPELILVSAGFDAHSADPLSGLDFRDDDYGWVAERIAETAEKLGVGVVSVLEGGYDLDALERSAERYMRALRDR